MSTTTLSALYLADCAQTRPSTYVVPSDEPASPSDLFTSSARDWDDDGQGEEDDDDDDDERRGLGARARAASLACTSQGGGFVLARALEGRRRRNVLELFVSRFSSTNSTRFNNDEDEVEENGQDDDDDDDGVVVARFAFASALAGEPHAAAYANGELTCSVLTTAGWLYTLEFPSAASLASGDFLLGDNDEDVDDDEVEKEERARQTWCSAGRVKALLDGRRTPCAFHQVRDGRVVIACTDGLAVVVDILDNGDLIETELKPPSSFSVRSLLPSFALGGSPIATRSAGSNASGAAAGGGGGGATLLSQQQIVSLATLSSSSSSSAARSADGNDDDDDVAEPEYAFAVSRDRKMRVWNLDSGACMRAIDLPRPGANTYPRGAGRPETGNNSMAISSSSTGGNARGSPSSPFDSPAKNALQSSASVLPQMSERHTPLIRVFADGSSIAPSSSSSSSSYAGVLVLFVPPAPNSRVVEQQHATFFIYGIVRDDGQKSRTVRDLVELARRPAPSAAALDTLLDVQLVERTLWCLFDANGETRIESTRVSLDDDDDDDEDAPWVAVEASRAPHERALSAHFFEEAVRAATTTTAASEPQQTERNVIAIRDVFLAEIARPGRYSRAIVQDALRVYMRDDLALAAADDAARAELEHRHQDADVLERLASVIGSSVQLEHAPDTGLALSRAFERDYAREWLRFFALCDARRRAHIVPLKLAVSKGAPGQDGQVVVVAQTGRVALARTLDDSERAAAAVDMPIVEDEAGDVVRVVRAFEALASLLAPATAREIELELVRLTREPLAASVRDIFGTLFDDYLDFEALAPIDQDDDDDEGGESLARDDVVRNQLAALSSPETAIQATIDLLTASTRDERNDEGAWPSQLAQALIADSTTAIIEARYSLAWRLVLLLVYVHGSTSRDADTLDKFDALASAALATLHALASVRWLAQQPAPSREDVDLERDDLVSKLGGMHVSRRGSTTAAASRPASSASSRSLLHRLVRSQRWIPALPSHAPAPLVLTRASLRFLATLDLSGPRTMVHDRPSDVLVAHELVAIGYPAQGSELAQMYPRGAGIQYVVGLAASTLGDAAMAEQALSQAASAFVDGQLEQSGLAAVLPTSVATLARFYAHAISLLSAQSMDSAVARLANLAIEAESAQLERESPEFVSDLWLHCFRSLAALARYRDAYMVVMAIPHAETQKSCLSHLISVMCENGEVALLTSLSFVGLQGEVERNLAFRARNSNPLGNHNYFNYLYAYHMAKGDHRSAGAVMYQQGRKLKEIASYDSNDARVTTMQCQCYLAAVNALSLVEPSHAWVAVQRAEGEARSNKRRKLKQYVPSEEFEKSPVDVVELQDVRQEYELLLARLQLADDFPELEQTNLELDPEGAVTLLVRTNAFEAALATASTLDVDMTPIFETLADRCVQLTRADDTDEFDEAAEWITLDDEASIWEGALSTRAWKLLERHLTRHDTPTAKYRRVVLERLLSVDRLGRLPSWLVDDFVTRDPAFVLRRLMRSDRTKDAFECSLAVIRAGAISRVHKPSAASACLPYDVFDNLLALQPAETVSVGAAELEGWQRQLRTVLDGRFASLEQANKELVAGGR